MATTDISIIKIRNLPDVSLVSETDEMIIQSSVDTGKTLISKFITDLGLMKSATITGTTGASVIGTHSGANVQQSLDTLNNSLQSVMGEGGAAQVGLSQGGKIQDAIKFLTPQMFGAKGDYNVTADTGTDDTLSFRQAIAVAITLGYQQVVVPAGNYLITGELNLGGVGYFGNLGVNLVGADMVSTIIFYRAATPTSPCISSHGGSGIHTSKGLFNMTLRTTTDSIGKGYGLQLRGSCFFPCENFLIWNFNTGIHLYNSASAGVFTEFNKIRFGRLHYNRLANILFEVDGGDNSFHGNDFIGIQNQVYTGAVGVKVIGKTKAAYLYNQNWQMNFFGGTGCRAFQLTNCNTDNLWGNLTHEGTLICETTDNSVFEFKGNFSGIGSLSYSIESVDATRLANFVFNNTMSNTSPFTNTRLSSGTPVLYNPQMADATDNGAPCMIAKIRVSGEEGLVFNTKAMSTGWWLTTTNSGEQLQSALPRYHFSADGNNIQAYTDVLYFGGNDGNKGIQLASTAGFVAPRTNNVLSLGTGNYKWTQVFATNSTIGTSNKLKKKNIRQITPVETRAFYEIGHLDSVWQWIEKYQLEGDKARLHSGPTVQDAIKIMLKHGLDWTKYSAFCYDKWEATEDTPAGEEYGFRKEELLFWILRATIATQDSITGRLDNLESLISKG